MGNIEYDDHMAGAGAPLPFWRTLAAWVGAGVALALVIGLPLWAWKLATREVAQVPVIRALEGPYRERPEEPGGQIAANQGLAVNRIPAEGEAGPTPDSVVLAPPPVDLDPVEDLPAGQLARAGEAPVDARAAATTTSAGGAAVGAPSSGQAAQAGAPSHPAGSAASVEEPASSAVEQALAEALGLPLEVEQGRRLPKVAVAPGHEDGRVPPTVPGVKRSPRPRHRPAAAGLPDAAGNVSPELSADALPSGAQLAHVGSHESRAEAEAAWAQLSARFAPYLAGRRPVIQEATRGGRVFYRLRIAGFEGLADARRFCVALVSEGFECITVQNR